MVGAVLRASPPGGHCSLALLGRRSSRLRLDRHARPIAGGFHGTAKNLVCRENASIGRHRFLDLESAGRAEIRDARDDMLLVERQAGLHSLIRRPEDRAEYGVNRAEEHERPTLPQSPKFRTVIGGCSLRGIPCLVSWKGPVIATRADSGPAHLLPCISAVAIFQLCFASGLSTSQTGKSDRSPSFLGCASLAGRSHPRCRPKPLARTARHG
jgi:hypothetical protein